MQIYESNLTLIEVSILKMQQIEIGKRFNLNSSCHQFVVMHVFSRKKVENNIKRVCREVGHVVSSLISEK